MSHRRTMSDGWSSTIIAPLDLDLYVVLRFSISSRSFKKARPSPPALVFNQLTFLRPKPTPFRGYVRDPPFD